VTVDLELDAGRVWLRGKELALRLPPDAASSEVEIHFTCSGYNDPGRSYGPPENCYPPEGDEERELDHLVWNIYDAKGQPINIDQDTSLDEIVWDLCQDLVDATDVDYD